MGVSAYANDQKEGDNQGVIQLFNQDGSLWYEFSFDDNSDPKFDGSNLDFMPFAFHRDYSLLALKCTRADADRYQAVVNEATGLRKYVRKNDRAMKLQTWKDHILDLFAVGFDRSTNPLVSQPAPRGRGARIFGGNVGPFHPVEIKGDRLKVSWDLSESAEVKHGGARIKYGGSNGRKITSLSLNSSTSLK